MRETVWDQEFFRRRAAGKQAASPAQEPAAATPPAPEHATIAGLLLARAGDDNTALLFADLRWSWPRGVIAVAVYPVPDPVTGDQVMAALEVPGGEFDPGAFWSFLGQQPDLGTKWAPRLVRITANLPLTATHKISKPALRRMLWIGDDPVYEAAHEGYVPITADRKAALESEYAWHGRDHLLRLLQARDGCRGGLSPA